MAYRPTKGGLVRDWPRKKRSISKPVADDTPLALRPEFTHLLGTFNGAWASLEMTTDYAIGRFLKVTPGEAHLITSGMMFGRKSRLLADLIGRSDHPKRSEILGAFNKVRGDSKRDIFAHSYVRSSRHTVTFLDRSTSGEFRAKEHVFTLGEFTDYVVTFTRAAEAFYISLDIEKQDIQAFANAALSLNRKSPDQPADKE